MSDAILAHLQQATPAMLALLERWVNHDSPAHEKAQVTALGEMVAAEAAARGARVERLHGDRYLGPLRCTWPGAGAPVLILAHIDTVFPMGEAARRPFRIEGDRCTGPGCYDMKGGLVQALFAIAAAREAGGVRRPVTLLVTGDEEIGSSESRPVIEAEARQAVAVLVPEPATGPGHLKTARKAVGMYNLTITGRAAHAGVEPEAGISAVREMAHQILYLEGLTDHGVGTTLNIGLVKGGSARNVVPAHAEALIDVRTVTAAEAERLDGLIRGVRPHAPGVSLSVSGATNRPPMERTAAIGALFALARGVAAELGFAVEESSTGGGSDGSFTAGAGVPTLDGLGCVGGGAHGVSEHVLIPTMAQRSALVAHLLQRL